jgi:hypothetical protein
MSIQRYGLVYEPTEYVNEVPYKLAVAPQGDWVTYDDHVAVVREHNRVLREIASHLSDGHPMWKLIPPLDKDGLV